VTRRILLTAALISVTITTPLAHATPRPAPRVEAARSLHRLTRPTVASAQGAIVIWTRCARRGTPTEQYVCDQQWRNATTDQIIIASYIAKRVPKRSLHEWAGLNLSGWFRLAADKRYRWPTRTILYYLTSTYEPSS